MKVRVYSIGYGGKTPEELVKKLKDAGVSALIDVRYSPKCGWNQSFSMKGLSEMLAKEHINYAHDKRLGNPKMKLELFTMEQEAMDALDEMFNFSKNAGIKVALLCAEGDADRCHRKALCRWLEKERDVEVIHL